MDASRKYLSFKLYKEEEVFGKSMLALQQMFRESQRHTAKPKDQDEDMFSDVDLVAKNVRDGHEDLAKAIWQFSVANQ